MLDGGHSLRHAHRGDAGDDVGSERRAVPTRWAAEPQRSGPAYDSFEDVLADGGPGLDPGRKHAGPGLRGGQADTAAGGEWASASRGHPGPGQGRDAGRDRPDGGTAIRARSRCRDNAARGWDRAIRRPALRPSRLLLSRGAPVLVGLVIAVWLDATKEAVRRSRHRDAATVPALHRKRLKVWRQCLANARPRPVAGLRRRRRAGSRGRGTCRVPHPPGQWQPTPKARAERLPPC